MPCAVFSYGQCWLPGPAPLALYVNMTCEFEPAPTRSGEVGRGWDSVQARYAYTISYDLERTVYLGPPARDDVAWRLPHARSCLSSVTNSSNVATDVSTAYGQTSHASFSPGLGLHDAPPPRDVRDAL
mgnify:CR=1 FL=1